MTTRAFVLIFFMWALLTIITPTLIILSESSKTDLDQNGKASEETKPRKMMMTYLEKHLGIPITPPAQKNVTEVSPTPTPAPAVPPPTSEVEPALRIETLFQKQRDQWSQANRRLRF